MKSNPTQLTDNLVLIGGGHSHAIVLKLWGMNHIPGVHLTLISDRTHTPYSGMLPGQVAGFYDFEETHIDLRVLAHFAGANFYHDTVINLDLENKQVICEKHSPITFDNLSIDIGSIPQKSNISGASDYAIPAKPVAQFLTAWKNVKKTIKTHPKQPYSLTIIGGGAGGVELAFNMRTCLLNILENANNLTLNLIHQGNHLLTGHSHWTSKKVQSLLLENGTNIYLNETVIKITPSSPHHYRITCDSGLEIRSDFVFLVTQASSPQWIEKTGITTDKKGFILVNNYLQSVSHPNIFAAGDIATMKNYSRPKAGVFAVRQGQPLFNNLQSIILGTKLHSYYPQKFYLSLIGTGNKKAIASWGSLGLEASWLWTWKDYIDRKFMDRFKNFSSMKPEKNNNIIDVIITLKNEVILNKAQDKKELENKKFMPCNGCASKVGSSLLQKTLQRLDINQNPEIIVGLASPDDAAIIDISEQELLVETIDYFPSFISDPFVFGQITTNHCLSDLWAMGAKAHSVSAVITLPYGVDSVLEEILYQLLEGCLKILKQNQVSLVGGHTLQGEKLGFGLSCNGFILPNRILCKSGMQPNDKIILTKPLGIGTLLAAEMIYQTKGNWIDNAIQSMLISNKKASEIFLQFEASACTDITGFGLVGHLIEMMKASQVSVELNLDKIPILIGAIETIKQGITSSLHPKNLDNETYLTVNKNIKKSPNYSLLFDPQTSGGLLASIPEENADRCLQELIRAGYTDSQMIGKVIHKSNKITCQLT
ncbi:selenide, water dikinase SelD [Crocosphaera chwakensis]|uniref:Selenide, water dikinase n=1 Tax=Crocosphaera chwakensis CCY0110 TaxID=391612 RepID=A3IWC4_9CHRO|nr:selenide, water dikinase SelD [Crocosphaera chwakensis]EAZ89237.1 selenide, water dikinase [Crocosphaera chwakensis CCY0110]